MFPSEAVVGPAANFEDNYSSFRILKSQRAPSVVIFGAEDALRDDLVDQLLGSPFSLVLVCNSEELKIALETENVVACLCGFELSDGRFRDVVNQVKELSVEVPVIQFSAAGSPEGKKDFLDYLIAGAFDFIRHPFRRSEVQEIVWSALHAYDELARNKWARIYVSSTLQSRFAPGVS